MTEPRKLTDPYPTISLIAGPHIFAVHVRPGPAWANAVTPPAAVPEMTAVSTRHESTGGKTRADARTGSMPNDDACTGRMSSHEMSTGSVPTHTVGGRNVPSAAVSTATASVSTATTTTISTTAAVSGRSACGERYAAKRESCGQRKD